MGIIRELQERITDWGKSKGFHVDLTDETVVATQAEFDLARVMIEHQRWDRVLETVRVGGSYDFAAHKAADGVSSWEVVAKLPPLVIRTLSKLALVSSENTEAADCMIAGELKTTTRKDGKPEGLGSELADIIIRVLHLGGCLGIDLETEIAAKLEHNDGRPYKHGKLL